MTISLKTNVVSIDVQASKMPYLYIQLSKMAQQGQNKTQRIRKRLKRMLSVKISRLLKHINLPILIQNMDISHGQSYGRSLLLPKLVFFFFAFLGSFWALAGYFWGGGGVRKRFWALCTQTNNFCFLSIALFSSFHAV